MVYILYVMVLIFYENKFCYLCIGNVYIIWYIVDEEKYVFV